MTQATFTRSDWKKTPAIQARLENLQSLKEQIERAGFLFYYLEEKGSAKVSVVNPNTMQSVFKFECNVDEVDPVQKAADELEAWTQRSNQATIENVLSIITTPVMNASPKILISVIATIIVEFGKLRAENIAESFNEALLVGRYTDARDALAGWISNSGLDPDRTQVSLTCKFCSLSLEDWENCSELAPGEGVCCKYIRGSEFDENCERERDQKDGTVCGKLVCEMERCINFAAEGCLKRTTVQVFQGISKDFDKQFSPRQSKVQSRKVDE